MASNSNQLGATYTDIAQIAAPTDPAAGTRRLFVNSATNEISVQTSSGSTVSLESSGAPTIAQYVTLATDSGLSNERVLTGTANQVILTDNGAGSTVVLSLPQSIATTSTPQFTRIGIGQAAGANDEIAVTQANASSGSPNVEMLTGGSHTTLAASTEASSVVWNFGQTSQWATGAVAIQRTVNISAQTIAAVGASAFTKADTVYISGPPIAGTNVTITTATALRLGSGNLQMDDSSARLNFAGSSGNPGVVVTGANTALRTYGNLTAASASYDVLVGGANNRTAGFLVGFVLNSSTFRAAVSFNGAWVHTPGALTSGVAGFAADYQNAAYTGQTASTEIINIRSRAYTRTWATGAITTQRENVLEAPTYAFAGSSTVTTAVNLELSPPTAGSNAQFLANYGLNITGDVTMGASAATTTYRAFRIAAHTVTLTGTTQVTSTVGAAAVMVNQLTLTDASAVTVDAAASVYIANSPVAAGSVTLTNAYSLWVDAGTTRLDGRLTPAQGADVASANDLTLGTDGNVFEITGTTQINAITTAGWTLGSYITMIFASTPTVKHNTAGGAGTAVILLAGAADFVATAGDTLTLCYSEQGGTNAWREISRAVI